MTKSTKSIENLWSSFIYNRISDTGGSNGRRAYKLVIPNREIRMYTNSRYRNGSGRPFSAIPNS